MKRGGYLLRSLPCRLREREAKIVFSAEKREQQRVLKNPSDRPIAAPSDDRRRDFV